MPNIKYVTDDGKEYGVDAKLGASAMDTAVENSVPGIDGDCGGAMACGTCHVYVDPAWVSITGTPVSDSEKDMLSLIDNAQETSRLACQISISDMMDGLVLRIPRGQH